MMREQASLLLLDSPYNLLAMNVTRYAGGKDSNTLEQTDLFNYLPKIDFSKFNLLPQYVEDWFARGLLKSI